MTPEDAVRELHRQMRKLGDMQVYPDVHSLIAAAILYLESKGDENAGALRLMYHKALGNDPLALKQVNSLAQSLRAKLESTSDEQQKAASNRAWHRDGQLYALSPIERLDEIPRTSYRLLHAFLPRRHRDPIERELEEQFNQDVQNGRIGRDRARRLYRWNVIREVVSCSVGNLLNLLYRIAEIVNKLSGA